MTEKRSQALVDEYLSEVRARLAPRTFDAYEHAVRRVLLPFLVERGLDVTEVSRADVTELAARLRDGKRADASVRSYLRQINVFLSWVGQRTSQPMAKAPLLRLRKKHRDVLSRAEMHQLEAAAQLVRDQLIIRLACDTGCRLGEIAAITVDDVVKRGSGYYVTLRGKTGERQAPISESVYRRLKEFIAHRPKTATSRRLWLSSRSTTAGYEPLQLKGIYLAIKDAAKRAKLETRIHPHALRHSAITRMVASGAINPAMISDITGVSVEVIAQHYSHPTDEDRYAAAMRFLGRED